MKKANFARSLALVSQLGISMITPIIICILTGNFLDDKFNTSPWIMVISIFLGVGAAFRNLFYMVGKEMKKGKKDE